MVVTFLLNVKDRSVDVGFHVYPPASCSKCCVLDAKTIAGPRLSGEASLVLGVSLLLSLLKDITGDFGATDTAHAALRVSKTSSKTHQ